jgi:4,5:9,10-diseco-3-hydroxy-5,9,17-trioxoandrosta-1(10),2-diene-4-oate hydrolase
VASAPGFHYVRTGAGTPIVLSPGAAWTYAWHPQIEALRHDHTVYAVDLPGQGFTELHERGFVFDLPGMSRAIDTFLDAVGLPSAALAGNSWSGGWALAYAQSHPQRVQRLVLLAPSGLAERDPAAWEALKLPLLGEAATNLSAGERSLVAASVRDLFVHKELVTDEVIDAMWAPGTFRDNLRSMYLLERYLDWRITERALPHTRTPTLIVWGDQDTVLPMARAERLGRLMPAATIHVLAGCGHALTLDCPEPVNTLMTEFLS